MKLQIYSGIDGLQGIEPVGAVLRIGRKKPGSGQNRAPEHRDRFYVVMPREDSTGGRPEHPAFGAFNRAEPDKRKLVRCVLVHGTVTEAWSHYLQAWRLPNAEAPATGPACHGDGVDATRFDPKTGGTRQIHCPHDKCGYRQGNRPACKPFARLLFRPAWYDGSPLPTPLMKFETRSWNTVKAIVGMFKHLLEQARHLGVESPSLYGFPFSLQLGEETRKAQGGQPGRKYPVVRPSPLVDVQSFLISQKAASDHIGRVATMLDQSEHDPDVVRVANRELSAPATDGAET